MPARRPRAPPGPGGLPADSVLDGSMGQTQLSSPFGHLEAGQQVLGTLALARVTEWHRDRSPPPCAASQRRPGTASPAGWPRPFCEAQDGPSQPAPERLRGCLCLRERLRILRGIRRDHAADAVPPLGSPPCLSPGQVHKRHGSPQIVQLAVSDVLDHGVDHHAEEVSNHPVTLEHEVFECHRCDRQGDAQQQRHHDERHEEQRGKAPEELGRDGDRRPGDLDNRTEEIEYQEVGHCQHPQGSKARVEDDPAVPP